MSNNVNDAAVMPDLLQQLPEDEVLHSLTGDGAYDTQPIYEAVIKRGAIHIIPPCKNARIRKGQPLRIGMSRSQHAEGWDEA